MKVLTSITFFLALTGCTQIDRPSPAELVQRPNAYHDRNISTCGQIAAGGGKCQLKVGTMEIWLSSRSELCQGPDTSITYANITGLFSAVQTERLVIRKAGITPALGGCAKDDT